MPRGARLLSLLTAATCTIGICLPALHAQAPGQRAALADLRDSLGRVADIAALERLRDHSDPDHLLRVGAIEHRLGELTGLRKHLDQAIRHFADATRRQPAWPEAWYDVALAKLELHDQRFPAKQGPYQPLGTDYLHGAADALLKALKADPHFAAAAERLAPTVLRQTFQPQFTEALGPLRQAASGPGRSNPALQMSQALLERETGHLDSALAAFDRFLRVGGDSGVGLLERSRTLFYSGRRIEGSEEYFAGADLATSAAAVAHYRSDLAWIALPAELAEFDRTTKEGRARWLRAFWQRRDVDDGRRAGERLIEHYRRLHHVMRHFRLPSEQSQQAASHGIRSPLARNRTPTIEDDLRALVRRLAAEERTGLGESPIGPGAANQVAGDSPGDAPADQLGEAYARLNDQTLLRAYRSDQHVVDDRGVIYMRHGEPAKRATYAGAETDPNESWLYFTSRGPWIVHFTGVAAATTLVEQLPLNPALLASRGGLDLRYERIADGAARYRLQPSLLEQDRTRGRQAIVVGTTTDSYSLRFERPADPIVQVFGVREGVDGEGRLLAVFAVRGDDLSSGRLGPDSIVGYPIALRILAENVETGAVHRLDTTRAFVTRRVLGKDEFLTGTAQLPVAAGSYRVQVIVADQRGEAGSVVRPDHPVVVPDLRAERLAMSGAVLGRPGSGQAWFSPPDSVSLNPLNAYPRGSQVQVYYQVGGMQPGRTYETRIEVRERGGKGDRVSANFRERSESRRAAWSRSIALGKLPRGEYVLTVSLTDVNGSASVRREQLLNVTKE